MPIIKTGSFTVTTGGTAQNLILGFVPDCLELWNDTIINAPANTKIAQAQWLSSMPNASAYVWTYNATPIQVLTGITTNGVTPLMTADASLFTATNLTITGISKAANASITATHAFTSGDIGVTTVSFHGIKGMTQMNTLTGVIQTVTSTTSFTVNINSTGFSTYSSGGIANIVTGSPYLQGGAVSSGNALAFSPLQLGSSGVLNTALFNTGVIGVTLGTTLMATTSDLWRYRATIGGASVN